MKKKVALNNKNISEVKSLIESSDLHTVCQSAKCPNIFECFSRKTSTFMLMGDICTRSCSFCGVESGKPHPLDLSEPKKIAEAIYGMRLGYAVITSVTRDDLEDGGARQFFNTVTEIKKLDSKIKVECLVPDFGGDIKNLEMLLGGDLDVLSHNMETVRDNYIKIRPQADYRKSLTLLTEVKKIKPGIHTKSGFMLGLGEDRVQIEEILEDLNKIGVDIITIGQYLQPDPASTRVVKYYTPQEIDSLKRKALDMGFPAVEAGPFVRSSYHAREAFEKALDKKQTL